MNKYKKLFGDLIIYLIGNIGSKLIALIMVSFYSYMFTPDQFGDIDVTQTTISLILPFVTLCIHEAVLRFSVKSNIKKQVILSNGFFIVCCSILISIPLCFLMDNFHVIGGNVFLIIIMVALEGFNSLFGQFCRGINKTKAFMLSGIVFTLFMASSNIVFLKYLNMGINGYFLAMIVGYMSSVTVLALGGKVYKYINFSLFDREVIFKMMRFSVPLIPNSLMWWLMNAADKYVILGTLGSEANGIYAVAGKLPAILSTFTTIFMQAWQVSAISESESKDKSMFYSQVFNGMSVLLFLMISAILMILKPFLSVVINATYTDTWKYVPFLLLSTAFSSFSAFLGANYTAMEKTGGALKTTIVGGALNVVLNFAFIKLIGLNGAAIATAISFFIVWLLRIVSTRKFVLIRINLPQFILSFFLIGIQIISLYYWNDVYCFVLGLFVGVLIIGANYKQILYIIYKMIRKE